MPEIKITIATVADAKLIAEMSRTTFYEAFHTQNTKEDMDKFLTEQFTIPDLMAEVGAEGNIFLLAYIDDKPSGYCRLREEIFPKQRGTNGSIELARIYCTADAIGKGVGSALMQRCIDIAKEMKKDNIWLGVWEHNAAAISFYKKFGFAKYDQHHFLLGNDLQTDWLMKKAL